MDRNTDVFAVTETWLAKETDEFIIRDLCPTGYEFYNVPRVSRFGGGIGVMLRAWFVSRSILAL